MSVRVSMPPRAGSACSGLMYSGVPIIRPCCVNAVRSTNCCSVARPSCASGLHLVNEAGGGGFFSSPPYDKPPAVSSRNTQEGSEKTDTLDRRDRYLGVLKWPRATMSLTVAEWTLESAHGTSGRSRHGRIYQAGAGDTRCRFRAAWVGWPATSRKWTAKRRLSG